MKKITFFGLSLVLFLGASIAFSEASRDAYHAYLNGYDSFNSYRGGAEWREDSAKTPNDGYFYRISESHQRYFTDVLKTRIPARYRQFLPSSFDKFLPRRHSTDRIYGKGEVEKTHKDTVIFNDEVGKNVRFRTFRGDDFSLQLPVGFFESDENKFRIFDSSWEVDVKKFDKEVCKTAPSLLFCAISISKGENYSNNLFVTSRVVRQSQTSDTVLGEVNLQTPIFIESFSAKPFNSDREIFVSRFFARNLTGKVFLVEVRIPLSDARGFISVGRSIFESLRIES